MSNNVKTISLLKEKSLRVEKDYQFYSTSDNRISMSEYKKNLGDSIMTIEEESVILKGQKKVIRRMFIKQKNSSFEGVGWIINEDILNCMICSEEFGLFLRPHHCRSCGNVVCHPCSPYNLIIEELKDLGEVRVCIQCYWGQDPINVSYERDANYSTPIPSPLPLPVSNNSATTTSSSLAEFHTSHSSNTSTSSTISSEISGTLIQPIPLLCIHTKRYFVENNANCSRIIFINVCTHPLIDSLNNSPEFSIPRNVYNLHYTNTQLQEAIKLYNISPDPKNSIPQNSFFEVYHIILRSDLLLGDEINDDNIEDYFKIVEILLAGLETELNLKLSTKFSMIMGTKYVGKDFNSKNVYNINLPSETKSSSSIITPAKMEEKVKPNEEINSNQLEGLNVKLDMNDESDDDAVYEIVNENKQPYLSNMHSNTTTISTIEDPVEEKQIEVQEIYEEKNSQEKEIVEKEKIIEEKIFDEKENKIEEQKNVEKEIKFDFVEEVKKTEEPKTIEKNEIETVTSIPSKKFSENPLRKINTNSTTHVIAEKPVEKKTPILTENPLRSKVVTTSETSISPANQVPEISNTVPPVTAIIASDEVSKKPNILFQGNPLLKKRKSISDKNESEDLDSSTPNSNLDTNPQVDTTPSTPESISVKLPASDCLIRPLEFLPTPWVVIKTKRIDYKKIFINLTYSDCLPLLTDNNSLIINNKEIQIKNTNKNHFLTYLSQNFIQFTLEKQRYILFINNLKETEDKTGDISYLCDVVIHTQLYELCQSSNSSNGLPSELSSKLYLKILKAMAIKFNSDFDADFKLPKISSNYKGVRSPIKINGYSITLGSFSSEDHPEFISTIDAAENDSVPNSNSISTNLDNKSKDLNNNTKQSKFGGNMFVNPLRRTSTTSSGGAPAPSVTSSSNTIIPRVSPSCYNIESYLDEKFAMYLPSLPSISTSLSSKAAIESSKVHVIFTSLIIKRNHLGIGHKRQLILTNLPSLFYVDLSTKQIKGYIEWDKDKIPRATNNSGNNFGSNSFSHSPSAEKVHFSVITLNRVYKFEDQEGMAEKWVNWINKVVQNCNWN